LLTAFGVFPYQVNCPGGSNVVGEKLRAGAGDDDGGDEQAFLAGDGGGGLDAGSAIAHGAGHEGEAFAAHGHGDVDPKERDRGRFGGGVGGFEDAGGGEGLDNAHRTGFGIADLDGLAQGGKDAFMHVRDDHVVDDAVRDGVEARFHASLNGRYPPGDHVDVFAGADRPPKHQFDISGLEHGVLGLIPHPDAGDFDHPDGFMHDALLPNFFGRL